MAITPPQVALLGRTGRGDLDLDVRCTGSSRVYDGPQRRFPDDLVLEALRISRHSAGPFYVSDLS